MQALQYYPIVPATCYGATARVDLLVSQCIIPEGTKFSR
eukprot:SAG31_NODE_3159_length_4609_cov_3.554324_2_plen_39_part_00